jgi:hypothetical protein
LFKNRLDSFSVRAIFFGHGGVAFLQGFFEKTRAQAWWFCGPFVVECVVNVVN